MKVIPTTISDILIMEPKVFGDERGYFFESFNERAFRELIVKRDVSFVQDNHSRSRTKTLRGALSGPAAAGETSSRRRRGSVRCGGRHPPVIAKLPTMGRRATLGGEQETAMDPGGICARFSPTNGRRGGLV